MTYQEKLEQLLDKYIEENKQQKAKYNKDILFKDLYQELLILLNDEYETIKSNKLNISFLFTSLYKDNIYLDEFYQILVNLEYDEENQKRLKQLINKIKEDYQTIENEIEVLKSQIYRNKHNVTSAYRVKTCFKYNAAITENIHDIYNIKRIISYFEISGIISNKEELLLINEIELYNRKIAAKRSSYEEQTYTDDLYSKMSNILNAGFQPHDVIEVPEDRQPILDKFTKEIFNCLSYIDKEEFESVIEPYKKYNLNSNEYNYIIIKILDNYLEELLTFYELLIDKEIYTNRSDRTDIIQKYYYTLNKYLYLKEYYEKINIIVEEEYEEEYEEEIEEIDNQEIKTLIYAHSNVNFSKTRIISDMETVPYEYYDEVKDLLDKFKNNTISRKELKPLSKDSDKHSYKELKGDQIRIVLKHIKENIYCVMGLFAKKDNNNRTMYKTFYNRVVPNINTQAKLEMELQLASYTEEQLTDLVEEKARKGIR